jgi:hypothetical protein
MIPHGREPRHSRWEDCPGAPDSHVQFGVALCSTIQYRYPCCVWSFWLPYCTVLYRIVHSAFIQLDGTYCTALYMWYQPLYALLFHVKLMTFSAVRIWPGNGTYCTIQCCTVLHCTVMVVAGSCGVLYCTFSNRWWTIGYWWLQYCAVLLVNYSDNNSRYCTVLYSNNHNTHPVQ